MQCNLYEISTPELNLANSDALFSSTPLVLLHSPAHMLSLSLHDIFHVMLMDAEPPKA
jgi:hypothetical protein